MIVDSQVHIWGADTPERPWPRNRPVKAQRDVPLGSDELLREMDAAGVSRVVIVPPSWEGDRNDLALAKYPNVATKVSCFPFFTTQTYPFRNLHPYLRKAYDAFGPKRTFWGTDLSRLPCTYRQGVTLFTEELPWLKGQDLEWVMGRGVCEWLGWRNV